MLTGETPFIHLRLPTLPLPGLGPTDGVMRHLEPSHRERDALEGIAWGPQVSVDAVDLYRKGHGPHGWVFSLI